MSYRFADCVFDPADGELRRAGRPVPLRPVTARILVCLLHRRGGTVDIAVPPSRSNARRPRFGWTGDTSPNDGVRRATPRGTAVRWTPEILRRKN